MLSCDPIKLNCDNCHYEFEVIVGPDQEGATVYEGNCPNCGQCLSTLRWQFA